MKIILSRKGFDNENGGYSSPIMPNGRLVSLPIPNHKDSIRYSDLIFNEKMSYFDFMMQLKPKVRIKNKWVQLTRDTRCHCDPDIYAKARARNSGWRGCLGQGGNAQQHLKRSHVTAGDVFLFFGKFKEVVSIDGKYAFDTNSRSKHVIFGYLQISPLQIGPEVDSNAPEVPDWIRPHPHMTHRGRDPYNMIYTATDRLTWDEKLPGFGVFNFDENLVLTKNGCSLSKWNLPDFFKNAKISYHSTNSWKEDYFQSANRGQEFVIDTAAESKIEDWTSKLIANHVRIE